METGIAIAVVVALFVGVFGVQWLGRVATRKANRAIFRRSNGQALDEVREVLQFSAPAAPEDVLAAIAAVVNAHPKAPALVAGLFVEKRRPDAIVFAFGAGVSLPLFRSAVSVASAQIAGVDATIGRFETLDWLETDGLVSDTSQVKRLRERVTRAIEDLGGQLPSAAPSSSSAARPSTAPVN